MGKSPILQRSAGVNNNNLTRAIIADISDLLSLKILCERSEPTKALLQTSSTALEIPPKPPFQAQKQRELVLNLKISSRH
jgi:hypothetical protein